MGRTNESLYDEMKRYVRFTGEDARRLAAFRPLAAPHFERIAAEFYDRIREHEGAHAVLQNEAQVLRLKRSLVRWLDRLLGGVYDQGYYEESSTIGRVHVRVGLPQHYMLTAMALIRVALAAIAREHAEAAGGDAGLLAGALDRVIDLELAIMLESYRDDWQARIERTRHLDREEADRSLAASEARYRQAVELARVMFVGLDEAGTVRLFNPEAERVTGYYKDEALGRPFVELVVPVEVADDFKARVVAGDGPPPSEARPFESVIRTKAGHLRDIRWQLGHLPGVGDDIAVCAVGVDITEQNALGARLRQSERLASIGTLAAGLAHEIRNPLNGAHLHLQVLARGISRAGTLETDALEAVQVVDDEIKRLANLVTEFLDFARPHPLYKRPVEMRPLCERVRGLVAHAANAAGVQVDLDLPDVEVVLEADPAKLEQVLLNLVRNAIEAARPGEGPVTLRVRKHPRFARIEVEDRGVGIENPDAPLFDPFYSTKQAGTGLGLAIVHRVVTDHGGSVEFKSGGGTTTFQVTLPLAGWNERTGAMT